MTMPLLDIRDLHAGYGKAEVLHGINLHADQAQVITVIGPCLLYTSPSPRDRSVSRMPSSA